MSEKVLTQFLTPTKLARAEDDWCIICSKPSMIEGPVVLVTMHGVRPWGSVKACRECGTRIWTTLKGNIVPVERIPEQNNSNAMKKAEEDH